MIPEIQSKLELLKERAAKVLELGGGTEQSLRSFFVKQEYKTLDLDPKSGADIIADAHYIPVPDGSFDGVIAFSILEHTHSPHVVISEIHRILQVGGHVLLTTPFLHPYHGGRCPDYYRFTKEGLDYLFKDFSQVEVTNDGGFFLALQSFVPQRLQPVRLIIDPILQGLDDLFTRRKASAHQFIVFARK